MAKRCGTCRSTFLRYPPFLVKGQWSDDFHRFSCTICIFWANYNNSLTWNKAILGMIPLTNHYSSEGEQWGRYNLSSILVHSCIRMHCQIYSEHHGSAFWSRCRKGTRIEKEDMNYKLPVVLGIWDGRTLETLFCWTNWTLLGRRLPKKPRDLSRLRGPQISSHYEHAPKHQRFNGLV